MPIVATLEDLDEQSLVKILKEPKNSLLKQYQQIFRFEGVKLIFKEEALLEIAKKAITKKTGARGLRTILESLLLKTMFDLPSQENVKEVIIDQSVVLGEKEPIVVYSKNKNITDKSSAA
jgi:ATP-dependent Clp protease ATP-binding subunit ClpX